jgi:hypothetical protein
MLFHSGSVVTGNVNSGAGRYDGGSSEHHVICERSTSIVGAFLSKLHERHDERSSSASSSIASANCTSLDPQTGQA